jgi:hypothetical protein
MNDHKTEIIMGIGVILLAIGILLIVPFILLWAINGLFSIHIEYTWMNWFYTIVILTILRGGIKYK